MSSASPRRRLPIRALVALWLALAGAACASQRVVQVRVTTPAGKAVGGVTIAWVCEPSGDAGAVTGEDGVATLSLFNSNPKHCLITVAKPGYETLQLAVDEISDPVEVELEETAP